MKKSRGPTGYTFGVPTSYPWDPANRLAVAILPTGARLTETYRFDDLRVAQQTSSGIQTFTWSGGEVLAQQGRTSGGVSWTELFTRAPLDGPNLLRS